MDIFTLLFALLGECDIFTIGDVAFLRDMFLGSVVFYGGVNFVGENAFKGCNNLQQIVVIHKELSKDEYESLKNNSKRNNYNNYVAKQMPKDLLPKGLLPALEHKPAANVPENIPLLFMSSDIEKSDKLNQDIDVNQYRTYISFSDIEGNITEQEAFLRHIEGDETNQYFIKSNGKNSWCRGGNESANKHIKKVLLFVWDDNCTYVDDDKYNIVYRIECGYFFWQSAQKVKMNDKDYYVYRRVYLTDSDEFVIKDVAIYCDGKLVSNAKEIREIYEKYKLL